MCGSERVVEDPTECEPDDDSSPYDKPFVGVCDPLQSCVFCECPETAP